MNARLCPTLHVEALGSGAPVVLLHSSGLSGRQWRRLASDLVARGRSAIVPDLTGHGASAAWPEPIPFSFTHDVEQIVALLAGLGRPADLVGHSYGGFLALVAARAAPRAVRSLVLFDPVAFGVLDASDTEALADLGRVSFAWEASEAGRERWVRGFVEYWGGEGAWAALREDARAEFRRVAWVAREGAKTLTDDRTPASAYRTLDIPVLLLGGERSPVAARRAVERLGEAIPGARVTVIRDAGHMGPLTHTAAVNEAALRALAPDAPATT
jgi:pimeloyl-ACP methyl ester carboxylesterase